MGYIKYLKKVWNDKDHDFLKIMQGRKIEWRKEPATTRIEYPTRIDRARALGYKAKQGFIVVRQRLKRGGHQRPFQSGGRKSSNTQSQLTLGKNYQQIAEERANKHFPNCEVLNSYYLDSDGKNAWYEIILIDRVNPSVYKDPKYSWAYETKGRVQRGITSAGRKSRGLRVKGFGAENSRPSRRSNRV
jgi:large subunit ribosomal protein L15e